MNLRQIRGQETKNRITQVAISLFHEKGFSNVTVDEIIEKSNTSKGAFYNHFKSKHDVFAEQFKAIDHYYVEHVIPSLDSSQPALTRLEHFLTMQMTYIEDQLGWDVTRTIYEQELNIERSSYFLDSDRPLYKFLTELSIEGIENGEIPPTYQAEEVVNVLLLGMRGVLYDWSLNRGRKSLVVEQEKFFEVLLKGLKK